MRWGYVGVVDRGSALLGTIGWSVRGVVRGLRGVWLRVGCVKDAGYAELGGEVIGVSGK